MNAVAPELAAAMAETRLLRDQLAALADDLEKSAEATAPSKKSEVERRCARSIRALLT